MKKNLKELCARYVVNQYKKVTNEKGAIKSNIDKKIDELFFLI